MSTTPAVLDQAQVIKSALAKIGDIATLPEVTSKIIAAVDDPKSTARDLHTIIRNDPALSTKILKVVNSAFYGLPGQVAEIDRAIVLLGLSAVKNIAISASISRLFTSGKVSDKFSAKDIWRHSVGVAVATRQFANAVGKKPFAEEAFLAGLIHDLGLLIERQAYPEQLSEIIREAALGEQCFCDVENRIIGADHQALGMALAQKWKFPRGLQIVLGYHHKVDNLSPENQLLPTMVYVADVMCGHDRVGFYLTTEGQPLDDLMLETIGLSQEDFNQIHQELPEQIEATESILMS